MRPLISSRVTIRSKTPRSVDFGGADLERHLLGIGIVGRHGDRAAVVRLVGRGVADRQIARLTRGEHDPLVGRDRVERVAIADREEFELTLSRPIVEGDVDDDQITRAFVGDRHHPQGGLIDGQLGEQKRLGLGGESGCLNRIDAVACAGQQRDAQHRRPSRNSRGVQHDPPVSRSVIGQPIHGLAHGWRPTNETTPHRRAAGVASASATETTAAGCSTGPG